MALTAPVCAKQAGITYRQLDHWIRKGYLPGSAPGSGVSRTFSMEERDYIIRLARLVKAGIDVAVASRCLPPGEDTFFLSPDVQVRLLTYEEAKAESMAGLDA